MSTTTQRLGLFKYDTIADSQVPFNIDDALNYNWDILEQKVGPNRNVGEIVASSLPLIDAGLHLLDGALILGDGIYSKFVEYIAQLYTDNPDANYFTDETTWQDSVTQYGVCGKFVYDSLANTVRLPKITGILEGTTDLSVLGDLVEAGLPSHNHNLANNILSNSSLAQGHYLSFRSDFGGGDYKYNLCGNSISPTLGVSGEANNSIYGKSNTVQPQTIKGYYYIVVATSTKTDIQVDIDEIATDLNGKADTDLSNVPNSKGILIESYVNGTSWYRVYSDGWCEQGGLCTGHNYQTIALLKTYIDTNYSINLTETVLANSAVDSSRNGQIISKTVSSFYCYINDQTNIGAYWRASGYII